MRHALLVLGLGLFLVSPVMAIEGDGAVRIKQLREENKVKIQQIKDAKRLELVKRIDTKLCQVRKNRANAMNRQIANLTRIVERVENTGKADATKLAEVKTALSDAKAAVDALASENCGVQITNSTSSAVVRNQVKESVAGAKDEWKAAHEKIEAAKKLLRELVTSTKVK